MSALSWKSSARHLFLHVFVIFIVCLTAAAQSSRPPLASADAGLQAELFADAAREDEAKCLK